VIETKVRVLRTDQGIAWVEPTEHNGCGACQAKSACAVSGLGRLFANRRQPIAVCADDAHPGQQFTVAMREADYLKVGVVAYLMPTLLAVLGAAIASAGGMGDTGAVLGLGLGLGVGLLFARMVSTRVAPPVSLSHRHATISSNQGETP
jgi:sigma-E factor negative regulatory protein RseC